VELLLVHQSIVLAPAFTDYESKQHFITRSNNEALEKLTLFAKEFIPPSIKVSYCVSENHLQETINMLLAESFHHLIFIGLKQTGLLKQVFMGSLAIKVIENSGGVVVAMPKDISGFSYKKVFVAVTEKYPLNILELNNFLYFTEKEITHLTFFYLAKPFERTKKIERQLKDLSMFFGDRFQTKTAIYKCQNPFEGIKKLISNKKEELLVVQKGSRFLIDRLFRRFMINKLVYEGQTPLIILP